MAVRVQLRDAEHLRVGHVAQHDLRVVPLPLELLHHGADAAGEDVVPQVHAEGVLPHEVLRALDGVGDALGGALHDVGDVHPPGGAVPQQLLHLFRHDVPQDDAQVRDARLPKVLQAVQDVGLVRQGDELLGPRVGQRTKAGAVAAGQDEPLHRPPEAAPRYKTMSRGELWAKG